MARYPEQNTHVWHGISGEEKTNHSSPTTRTEQDNLSAYDTAASREPGCKIFGDGRGRWAGRPL